MVDLGCGTGTLAIGAAWLGASRVFGVEVDPQALSVARENARVAGVEVTWIEAELGSPTPLQLPAQVDTVVMNPPFGAQRRHADRPFLEAVEVLLRPTLEVPKGGAGSPVPAPGGALYLLANSASQAFIERWSMARHLTIEEHRRSSWPLPRTFSHHRESRGQVEVDRWILRRR